jgi:hypothetical protein
VSILLAAGILAGCCTIACGLLYAFHRLGRRDVLLVDTTRGAGVYAVVGTSFAVLLAFVVLVAFQSYDKAESGAQAESDAMIELFRAAEFFPTDKQDQLQGDVGCYARAVVTYDWPAMRDGKRSPKVDVWSFAIQHSFPTLPVETLKEQSAFDNLLNLSDDRVDARRERLTEATPIITTPVWFILGVGALLNIMFVLVFIDRRSESLVVQSFLMASVTAMVVAGLLLIWFLDHPYRNSDGSIKPTEMENAISVMQHEDPNLHVPCNKAGDAFGPGARPG